MFHLRVRQVQLMIILMHGLLVFSNLIIGVYIGSDNPRTLGKFETDLKQLYQFLKILFKMLYTRKILENLKFRRYIFDFIKLRHGLESIFRDKNTIFRGFKGKRY